MARCFHGMPGWCAVCNGTVRPPLEGHPYARPDDEPRFAKGRDSAKWIGKGESIKADTDTRMRAAIQPAMRMLPSPGSWWFHALNASYERRDTSKAQRPAGLTPTQVVELIRVRRIRA